MSRVLDIRRRRRPSTELEFLNGSGFLSLATRSADRSADTRVAITASSTAVFDQQTAEGASRRSRGAQHLGSATGRRPCPPESWWTTMRSSRRPGQDSSSGIVNGCGPKSPGSHRAVWGLIARPPVSPAGFPPVPRLPAWFFPFVRLPLVSLRPAFSGSFPSAVARFRFSFGSLRVPFPLGNPHASAAAERFRRRWPPTAGTKVISPAATSCWIARCACTAGVQRLGTMRCRHRIT